MDNQGTFLGLNRNQWRDVGLGIGRGFQSYDPNNPFAGAGAAMEASIGSGMARDVREQNRSDALAAEERQASRAEQSAATAFERQKELMNFRIDAEGKAEEAQYQKQRKRTADELAEEIAGGVVTIDNGGSSQFDQLFAAMTDGAVPTVDFDPSSGDMYDPTASEDDSRVPFSWMRGLAKGKASDEGDLPLVSDGMYNGDPVGLEAFDLVRTKSGKTAIRYGNKKDGTWSVVPIDRAEWMALFSARQKTRQEVRQRMDFAKDVRIATDSIGKMTAAIPAMQNGLGQSLAMYAQIDPKGAMEYMVKASGAIQTGTSNELTGQVRAKIQDARNESALAPYTRSFGKTQQPDPRGDFFPPITVDVPSRRDQEVQRLVAKPNLTDDERITLTAFSRLEHFVMPPDIRKAFDPNTEIGFMSYTARDGRAIVSPLSPIVEMQHLAASGVFPETIPLMDAPLATEGADAQMKYVEYLHRVDTFASQVFGWDQSPREDINAIAQFRIQYRTERAVAETSAAGQGASKPQPQPTQAKKNPTGDAL